MKKQVVVLGRNYSSLLGMIRAAGEAGCEVTVVRTVRKYPNNRLKDWIYGEPLEAKSKYVKKHIYAIEPNDREMIEKVCGLFAEMKEKVVLLPTDDFTASAIDRNQDLLKGKFLYPNIDYRPNAIVDMMDKHVQKGLARAAGLNVAEGWEIQICNGHYTIPDDIKYPCFTKPEISFMGSKTYMKRCNSKEELNQVISEVAQKGDCPILVEQFVEIQKEYALLGVSLPDKIIIPDVIEMISSGHGAHKGVTLLGQISPLTNDEIREQLIHFIQSIGFVGLFDIDMYQQGDVCYFNELNLRFGASGFALTGVGINLPRILIEYFSGIETEKADYSFEKKMYVNEKVNFEDYSAGFISWEKYQDNLRNGELRFIHNPQDPKPFKYLKKRILYLRFRELAKKGYRFRRNSK